MSLKRSQETQGGDDRYGAFGGGQQQEMESKPTQATAAQMARRKIASTRKPSGSARSSRAGTPTAPTGFQQQPTQQQSMPSFLQQGQSGGPGSDGGFSFSAGSTPNNPFAAQQNGTPPPNFGFGQQNGGGMFGSNAGGDTGTPPPPSNFAFGQSNGGSMFGSNTGGNTGGAPSFGSTFGSNSNAAAQTPQQNGFAPSTNVSSNQTSETVKAPTFGGFGQNTQTSQPQQNGLTPSTATTSSFPSFGKANNDNPFKNFQFAQNTQPTQSTPNTSFGGSNSQQTNGDKAPATPFGGFGSQKPNGEKSSLLQSTADTPKPSSSLFTAETPKPSTSLFSGTGGFGQTDGASKPEETPKASTSLFGGTGGFGQSNGASKPAETPKASTPSFGNNTSTGLFGASASKPEERPTTPGGSVLTGLDSARASTIKTGMFTQNNNSSTPKANMSDGASASGADETPKPSSNLFSAPATNGFKSDLFSGASTTPQQTPAKQTSNLFSGSFSQQPQQSSTTPGFMLGQSTQSQQDTSMHTPGTTPQKSMSLFEQSQSQPAATEQTAPPSETPAGQGKSLFDRVSYPEQPTSSAKSLLTPKAPMFSGFNNKENRTPSNNSLFVPATRNEPSSTTQQQTSFTPSTSLFTKPAGQASQTPSAAPWLSHTAATPAALPAKVTPPTPQAPATVTKAPAKTLSMNEVISDKEKDTFKVLNEGMVKHLSTQSPNADWTTIMEYYLQQAAEIRGKPEPKFEPKVAQAAPNPQPSSGLLRENPGNLPTNQRFGSQQTNNTYATSNTNVFNSAATPTAPASNSSNLFAAAQTPKQPTFNTQTSRPPATEPVNKKRRGPFEEDDDEDNERGPATEKRARHDEPVNYPKLPEGASETAKLFAGVLDKQPLEQPKSGFEQKDTAASNEGFKPSTSSALGGFTPAASTSTGFTPSNASDTSTGPPKFSAPTGGFLSAFGKRASEESDKEKMKRKLEDYESDEETEEEWAKRDEEEQAAKRKKIMDEGKKATGFKFSASSTSKPGSAANIFGHLSSNASEASASDVEGDKAESEKAQGRGDNTWSMKTPIKFGASTTSQGSTTPAAPPPAFGNLFGSTPASSSHLNVPGANKPTFGFNFASNAASSTGTSRASTPGVTTDGEGSAAGDADDEAPTEEQVEDQTGLRAEEMKGEDLIATYPTITAKKLGLKKDTDNEGQQTKGWLTVGVGPLYVLKNQETGRARVLLKVAPLGTAKMNFPLISNMNYDARKRWVQGAFMDHINAGGPKAVMTPYMLDCGTPETAAAVAKVFMENKGEKGEA